jgi:hypothetical protein
MRIAVDLDGTLCSWHPHEYEKARPLPGRVEVVRQLAAQGHEIVIYTARGSALGSASAADLRWGDVTRRQLAAWDVPHAALLFGKPAYDVLIDDRAVNFDADWLLEVGSRVATGALT